MTVSVDFAPYGEEIVDMGSPSLILRNLSDIGSANEADRSEMNKAMGAASTRALQAAAYATAARRGLARGSVAILGASVTGIAVAEALLAMGWPAHLVEVATTCDDEHVPGWLSDQGVASSTRIGGPVRRAAVVVVCALASRLDDVARPVRRLGAGKLVISCVVGVQTSKQRVAFGDKVYLVRTRVAEPPAEVTLEAAVAQAASDAGKATAILGTIHGYLEKGGADLQEVQRLPKSVDRLEDFVAAFGVLQVNKNRH